MQLSALLIMLLAVLATASANPLDSRQISERKKPQKPEKFPNFKKPNLGKSGAK
jgi:hypothetical protein